MLEKSNNVIVFHSSVYREYVATATTLRFAVNPVRGNFVRRRKGGNKSTIFVRVSWKRDSKVTNELIFINYN